jgi:NADPH2:quinone reductase
MKALLSTAAGGPETLVLSDVPEPNPGRGEVSIEVHAVGVNFPDALVIRDLYQFKPARPFAPGAEFAGRILAVGDDVAGLAPGDRVLATNYSGGMAEVAIASANHVVTIPEEMPFAEAAAFLQTYGTVFHALEDRASLQRGETLLVLGAAGGVGVAAIELGKAAGARVVAAVSSEEKAAFAGAHGADEVVVYPSGPLDKTASRALADAFKQALARMALTSCWIPLAATMRSPLCGQSAGGVVISSSASPPASPRCP